MLVHNQAFTKEFLNPVCYTQVPEIGTFKFKGTNMKLIKIGLIMRLHN